MAVSSLEQEGADIIIAALNPIGFELIIWPLITEFIFTEVQDFSLIVGNEAEISFEQY